MPKMPEEEKEESKVKGTPAPTGKTRPANPSEGAFVYVEKGFTKNLGNYESAKVSVGIQLPINADKKTWEEVDALVTVMIEKVDERLVRELDALDKGI